MNTRFLFYVFAMLMVAFFSSCSKPRKNDFFVIKFEIITTAEVSDPYPSIVTQGGLVKATHTNFTSGKRWENTIDFETSHRPLYVILNGQNIRLKDPGKVTLNIYVNNKLKGTSTRETAIFEGKHTVTTAPVMYVIE